MKKLSYILVAISMIGCGQSSFKTEGGTEVTYLRQGNGATPVDSLVSMFRIRYTTEEGKLMMDQDEPMPLKIDPNSEVDQGELFNVLKQLKTGDSVTFELVASELFSKTFRAPLPDSIAQESKIKFQVAYMEQLSEADYFAMVEKKAAEVAEKQMVIDTEIIDNYLAENNIEAQRTESGLRYVITKEGTGPQPEAGQTVSVNYSGYILNGPYFDSSVEKVARENDIYNEGRQYVPFNFPIGQGRVIKGWDEGIALLNVGTKATLYIPSPLGYGQRSAGSVIKPNSILVFDVELVGVE
ncbi:MAG: hypothetical protein Tsb0034_05860 [Ekhidna sp.]